MPQICAVFGCKQHTSQHEQPEATNIVLFIPAGLEARKKIDLITFKAEIVSISQYNTIILLAKLN